MNDRDSLPRPWLASYPPGVPATINPDEYASLKHLLERSFAQHAARPAYISMGRVLRYSDVDRMSADLAAWLQQAAGLEKGDRLAIMLPNLLQYPIALVAAFRAGLTVVNTNPLYTPRELRHQLSDSGARAIVILENFAHVLDEVIEDTAIETVIVTGVGDLLGFPKAIVTNLVVRHVRRQVPEWSLPEAVPFNYALSQGHYENLVSVDIGSEDIAFLQYTGGTTGVAKGAVLTHRNLVANVLQLESWFAPALAQTDESMIVGGLPMYHVFALTQTLFFLDIGGCNLLIANPRDFTDFVAELRRNRFTFMSGVNTLFNALLNAPGFAELDFSHLRVSLGGGMAVQRAVAERWKKVTGNTLTEAWGLTETSPGATVNRLDETEFTGSIGLPLPSTDISIRDDEGGPRPVGQSGEICVAGPQVMREYWRRPDETAKVMLPGRVLRTGDIGHMDARGYVYIDDRKKDMILVSGFNVYPNEVEGVAATHPGVLEVAAVAQPDERAGEVVALFIVRKDPSLTEHALIEHCRESLTGYKVPRRVYFRDELPKTNVGKILRRALRDELAKSTTPSGASGAEALSASSG
jgi:long-chain acyl-CoA synthetase